MKPDSKQFGEQRLTISPEWLKIGGLTYNQESLCATTFMILGDVVVSSGRPHLFIINGLNKMKGAKDLKCARSYDISFSAPLGEDELLAYQENWCGVMGEMRRRYKAGRIWSGVPDNTGTLVSVISFWGDRSSTDLRDLANLMRAFAIEGEVWVEWIDSKAPELFQASALCPDE